MNAGWAVSLKKARRIGPEHATGFEQQCRAWARGAAESYPSADFMLRGTRDDGLSIEALCLLLDVLGVPVPSLLQDMVEGWSNDCQRR